MHIVIEIPDKEFGVDINDKFQDFFSRLKAETKEHLITNTSLVCGTYELETINMFLKAFKDATPLPKGHGRLKDVDHYIKMQWEHPDYSLIDDEPTIIEADKAENENKG